MHGQAVAGESLAVAAAAASVFQWGGANAADDKPYVDQHYPDFGYLPPATEYKGRVFTLSQKYPKAEPESRLPHF